jgi:hypothetical protein
MLGELDGDCARAAGTGSRDVGDTSGGSSVEKLASGEAGEGCVRGCAWWRRRSLWRRQHVYVKVKAAESAAELAVESAWNQLQNQRRSQLQSRKQSRWRSQRQSMGWSRQRSQWQSQRLQPRSQ